MTTRSLSDDDIIYARAEDLKADNINPYVKKFMRSRQLFEVNEDYEGAGCEYESEQVALSLCGRVMAITSYGDSLLIMIEDQDSRLQILLDPLYISMDRMAMFQEKVCRGDYLGFEVDYICRIYNRVTARASEWKYIAICLLPLPKVIASPERQRRQRYVHLAGSIDARESFIKRAQVIRHVRNFMAEGGFLEVNTPSVGSTLPSETYLKQLLVGGLERVYEVRQESISLSYGSQQPFASYALHSYMVFTDLNDLMHMTEQLFVDLTQRIHSTLVIPWKPTQQLKLGYDDFERIPSKAASEEVELNLVPTWTRCQLLTLIEAATGISFEGVEQIDEATKLALFAGAHISSKAEFSGVLDILLEIVNQCIAPTLIQPTFLIIPQQTARQRIDGIPSGEHFHLYINGIKFAEGMCGLTDPSEVKSGRLDHKSQLGENDQNGPDLVADLHALKYGVPPFAGVTVDIDVLVMLMTMKTDIEDVVYFPVVR